MAGAHSQVGGLVNYGMLPSPTWAALVKIPMLTDGSSNSGDLRWQIIHGNELGMNLSIVFR